MWRWIFNVDYRLNLIQGNVAWKIVISISSEISRSSKSDIRVWEGPKESLKCIFNSE